MHAFLEFFYLRDPQFVRALRPAAESDVRRFEREIASAGTLPEHYREFLCTMGGGVTERLERGGYMMSEGELLLFSRGRRYIDFALAPQLGESIVPAQRHHLVRIGEEDGCVGMDAFLDLSSSGEHRVICADRSGAEANELDKVPWFSDFPNMLFSLGHKRLCIDAMPSRAGLHGDPAAFASLSLVAAKHDLAPVPYTGAWSPAWTSPTLALAAHFPPGFRGTVSIGAATPQSLAALVADLAGVGRFDQAPVDDIY